MSNDIILILPIFQDDIHFPFNLLLPMLGIRDSRGKPLTAPLWQPFALAPFAPAQRDVINVPRFGAEI